MEPREPPGATGRPLPPRLEPLRPLVRRARVPYRRLKRLVSAGTIAGACDRIAGPGVALTFDDGPDPVFTHEVLDVLADRGVTATFFVVGDNARRHPSLIRRMVAEGHGVASHSMTHPDPWRLRPVELWRDYRTGHLEVAEVLGHDVRLFRPPKGHIDRRGALVMRAAGLRPYLWTLDAADWEPDLRPEDVVERLGRPVAGDVILLHDGLEGPWAPEALDRSAMVAGLRRFLDRALGDGVVFAPLPGGSPSVEPRP